MKTHIKKALSCLDGGDPETAVEYLQSATALTSDMSVKRQIDRASGQIRIGCTEKGMHLLEDILVGLKIEALAEVTISAQAAAVVPIKTELPDDCPFCGAEHHGEDTQPSVTCTRHLWAVNADFLAACEKALWRLGELEGSHSATIPGTTQHEIAAAIAKAKGGQ